MFIRSKLICLIYLLVELSEAQNTLRCGAYNTISAQEDEFTGPPGVTQSVQTGAVALNLGSIMFDLSTDGTSIRTPQNGDRVISVVTSTGKMSGCTLRTSGITISKSYTNFGALYPVDAPSGSEPQTFYILPNGETVWQELYSPSNQEIPLTSSNTNWGISENIQLDYISTNPCYSCNAPSGASRCQSNGTHCIPQYTNTCGFCTHVGVQTNSGPPSFTITTTWYDDSTWADGVAGCQASTDTSCTYGHSGVTYQCSSNGLTQGCNSPVGEVCLTSPTVDCTECTHIGVQSSSGPPLFTTTTSWYDGNGWPDGVAGCQASTGNPCTYVSGVTYQCSSDGGSTSNCQSSPQNCHAPPQVLSHPPPTLPPLLPPPLPLPLPPPSPPPTSPPSSPPLPENPPLYPSPFSPPPLNPPSLPTGAEITVRHYIPADTQVTFALAVNTTLDLNTIHNQNFTLFDTFSKIKSSNNRKILTRAVYNGNNWEPELNAKLDCNSGYIVRLKNGLDIQINGTVLESEYTNEIPENTQVTFSVKKNIDLNSLNKNLFGLNDSVKSISMNNDDSRVIETVLFDGNNWVPSEFAYLTYGIGYVGKFQNGLNKIL